MRAPTLPRLEIDLLARRQRPRLIDQEYGNAVDDRVEQPADVAP